MADAGPTAESPSGGPEIDSLLAAAQQAGSEGRWDDAEAALRSAAAGFAAAGASSSEVRIRLQLAVLQASTGRVDAALAGIEACTTTAEGLVDEALAVEIHGAAASLLLAAARPRPAVDRFRTGLDLAVRLPDPRWQVQLRTGLAMALFQNGEPGSSFEVLQDNAIFARTLPDAVTAGMALQTVSEALALVGRRAEALDVALEALAKFEEGKAGPFLVQASMAVTNLCLLNGQPAQAAKYTTQSLALGRTFGGPSGEASVLLGLARTAIQRGDGASAHEFVDRAKACLAAAGLAEPHELAEITGQLTAGGGSMV